MRKFKMAARTVAENILPHVLYLLLYPLVGFLTPCRYSNNNILLLQWCELLLKAQCASIVRNVTCKLKSPHNAFQ